VCSFHLPTTLRAAICKEESDMNHQLDLERELVPKSIDADPDPAAHELKLKIAFAKPRRRQGALTRYAASIDQCRTIATTLRERAQQSDGAAIRCCVAVLAGVSERALSGVTVGRTPGPGCGIVHIDVSASTMWTDLGRLDLRHAAKSIHADQVLPASRWAPKPIPRWLNDQLSDLELEWGEIADMDLLVPLPPTPRGGSIVDGEQIGRMRATLPRLQAGLSTLMLDLGIDELTTALALNDLPLVPRSRLFYVAVDAKDMYFACRDLYAQIGWADVTEPATNHVVGSMVVPKDSALVAAWTFLRNQAEVCLPPRRWSVRRVIEHHNQFVLLVAWLLVFLLGARESRVFPLSAAACRRGAMYVIYPDKRVGPFGSARPALVCPTAQRQIHLYYSHLSVLAQRGEIAAVGSRWLRHVQDILAGKDVSLLFRIDRDDVEPLGTADVLTALPEGHGLAPNFGRHFWQTALHRAGLSSHVIDFYARHVTRGTESMTSTTLMPLITAHESVSAAQESVLTRLGIQAVAGQGKRSRT
jgi:hypothetical protein